MPIMHARARVCVRLLPQDAISVRYSKLHICPKITTMNNRAIKFSLYLLLQCIIIIVIITRRASNNSVEVSDTVELSSSAIDDPIALKQANQYAYVYYVSDEDYLCY